MGFRSRGCHALKALGGVEEIRVIAPSVLNLRFFGVNLFLGGVKIADDLSLQIQGFLFDLVEESVIWVTSTLVPKQRSVAFGAFQSRRDPHSIQPNSQ